MIYFSDRRHNTNITYEFFVCYKLKKQRKNPINGAIVVTAQINIKTHPGRNQANKIKSN